MTDVFMAEGGSKYPALKFSEIGDTHSGKVVEVKKLEDRDPDGNIKTWPNGDPRFVFVFTIAQEDGFGNIWARGNMVKTIREAASRQHLHDGWRNPHRQIHRRRRKEEGIQRTEALQG